MTTLHISRVVGGISGPAELFDWVQQHASIRPSDVRIGGDPARPLRYAFLEFRSPDEAQRALQVLNGKILRGEQVVVSEATTQRRRAPVGYPPAGYPPAGYPPMGMAPPGMGAPGMGAPGMGAPGMGAPMRQHPQYAPYPQYPAAAYPAMGTRYAQQVPPYQADMQGYYGGAPGYDMSYSRRPPPRSRPRDMARLRRTVHISNLDSRITDTELRRLFRLCGSIIASRIAGEDRQETRFAFIEFQSVQDAERAISVSGQQVAGRQINIEPSRSVISGHLRSESNPDVVERTLHVGNIHGAAKPDELAQFVLEKCGAFNKISLTNIARRVRQSDRTTQIGFVEFDSRELAVKAREALNDQEFRSMRLRVEMSRTSIRRPSLVYDEEKGIFVPPPELLADEGSGSDRVVGGGLLPPSGAAGGTVGDPETPAAAGEETVPDSSQPPSTRVE